MTHLISRNIKKKNWINYTQRQILWSFYWYVSEIQSAEFLRLAEGPLTLFSWLWVTQIAWDIELQLTIILNNDESAY